ncbi:MAG: GDP-L-fucose synthase [Candidatus Omnitrophica bacterium]|nr:GDP-L-fucose synthase [Candidatus Omnitrophota bacterium]
MQSLKVKIYIAGHTGLVGSAVLKELTRKGYKNLVFKSSKELDLKNQKETEVFFKKERPEYVFLCAAKVGGILANSSYPAQFIYENLAIQNNVIHFSYKYGARKLLFLGSSCIYPKLAVQPIKENSLLSGYLEETNKPYAVAKIAGITMCQSYNAQYKTNFISAMPTNLYGPGDRFDAETSHVIPALLLNFHRAKKENKKFAVVWGTGKPRREFLYIEDLAKALVFLMKFYNGPDIINVGTGEDISIKELAYIIKEVVGFKGSIRFDASKPDGTPRKLLDVSNIRSLGWQPEIPLEEGLKKEYRWFLKNYARK